MRPLPSSLVGWWSRRPHNNFLVVPGVSGSKEASHSPHQHFSTGEIPSRCDRPSALCISSILYIS